jgi:23S rRNA (adenine2503-C2)-methyltransferase
VLTDIKSQTAAQLEAQFHAWGEPAYRVSQLLDWIYRHGATDWGAMTNLPKALREKLRASYALQNLELVRVQGSGDTTRKFLWRLADHSLIESVMIPANPALYGEASDRLTLCVSTQVGCAYGCKFCASGLDGFKRNLTVEEIVDQVLAAERWLRQPGNSLGVHPLGCSPTSDTLKGGHPAEGAEADACTGAEPAQARIGNLVIMGMGEPLANYNNLLAALGILNAPWGAGIGARKITISTSGLARQIRKLAGEAPQFRLAISLHGATDEIRDKIMPVNRKYPLRELTAACEDYVQRKGRMLTFEYILIAGVNDNPDQAKPLAALARRLEAKVNLIPYNKVEDLPWERPDEPAQEAFLAALRKCKVSATLRREKGHDIDAACGQLRLKTEREEATRGAGE